MMKKSKLLDRAIGVALAAPLCVALFVHGSTKPSPIVTEEGIKLSRVAVTATQVALEWSSTDERITAGVVYMVQKSVDGGPWTTVYATTETNATFNCFTVDRDTRWRIAVDLGEIDETEAGE